MTKKAQQKVEQLQQLAEAAEADAAVARDRLREIRERKAVLASNGVRSYGFAAAAAEAEKLDAEALDCHATVDKAAGAAGLATRCADLVRGAGYRMADAPVPVQLAVGQSYRQAVDEVRADLDKLDDLRRETNNRPAAQSDAVEAIRRHVEFLAASGRPQVSSAGNVTWPANGRGGFLSFFAWADPERLIERLTEQLPEEEPDAISEADRESELAAIAEERLALERYEEALIAKAEAAGQRIDRRADAAAEAVLQVEVRPYGVEDEAEAA